MRRLALLALAGTVFAGQAFAAVSPINGSFQVQANVPESCIVVSTNGIDFGDYDPVDANDLAGTDVTAAGSIVVRCTRDTDLTIELGNGANGVAASTCDAPQRQMTTGTDDLAYSLFADDNSAWGCNGAAQTRTATSSTTDITLNTNGVIPRGLDVGVGTYLDTVAYTITF